MNKNRKYGKLLLSSLLVGAMTITSFYGTDLFSSQETVADAATVKASITEELTTKREKFVKQFAMTDGSFTAVTYSMPVHYKVLDSISKGGKWKEINTTLVKSGKNKYKTKATSLSIKVSKKANKKADVLLKRGKSGLSIALSDKKLKKSKAKVSNPKKVGQTDVLNQNTVTYKKVMKNTNISYDIFPEKVQEIVTVAKKQKNKSLLFKLNSSLKVKVKGKKVYFKTKKGKIRHWYRVSLQNY